MQPLNMMGLTNKYDFCWRVFGLDAKEKALIVSQCMDKFTTQVKNIEANGVCINGTVHTFDFILKADQAFMASLNGFPGPAARFFSPFYNVSKSNAVLFDEHGKAVDAVIGDWYVVDYCKYVSDTVFNVDSYCLMNDIGAMEMPTTGSGTMMT